MPDHPDTEKVSIFAFCSARRKLSPSLYTELFKIFAFCSVLFPRFIQNKISNCVFVLYLLSVSYRFIQNFFQFYGVRSVWEAQTEQNKLLFSRFVLYAARPNGCFMEPVSGQREHQVSGVCWKAGYFTENAQGKAGEWLMSHRDLKYSCRISSTQLSSVVNSSCISLQIHA